MNELPVGLDPLLDVEQLRASDRWAIEERGMGGGALMERAAEGLARAVAGAAPSGDVLVVCGGGNNGGDGYAAARLLRGAGRRVVVAWTSDPAKLSGDAAAMRDALEGDAPVAFSVDLLAGGGFEVVVDAMLGTGFSGTPREPVAAAIEAINNSSALVVAADVPSGVDAATGAIAAGAVRADVTVTFHAAMPGLWIAPGKQHAGVVEVVDIGIPEDGNPVVPYVGLIGDDILKTYARRGAASTKFASGHVLVAGGARGLTGAPCLASTAAMRAGAGYVTACVPGSLNNIFEVKLTEVMTAPLADEDGAHSAAGADEVVSRAEARGGALVLGPGIGRTDGALAFARAVAARAQVALVLDADGLNAHAGALELLRERGAPTVLTPHGGELARLLAVSSDDVAAARLDSARAAAAQSGAVVVLKGDDTIVAEPVGRVAISRGGAPALATAGTGDVLSGILGAFLARGMEPFEAAAAAVHVHVLAGQAAARALDGPDGVIASDVIEQLPRQLSAERLQ
ncbi:bifunctional ADP-dependent NAD(P)H-hydrate dehydratase/NAD(P)H-hydrate epimerase [Conexibacter woesei]|uniref:bifunctional ADP-dependent NAD(P)H-hydrate dehydratase/NAD(P)H-hydrate epimerase n=1 Tax=Conexibacter woesei TaxID=191495 RepID=UPI00040CFCF4|nr:bifunctional ADP-dependent NAD(P)H-hydrate dehydratase/NAD(P)H-hydrate epimerase [Conexibacter woesei]